MTRLGLLDALTTRLRTRPLEEIGVRELCAAVNVSEPTFFNYFGSKQELLILYVRLWSIERQLAMEDETESSRAALEGVFESLAAVLEENPRLVHAIVSHILTQAVSSRAGNPTRAELLLRFPADPGAVELRPQPVGALIRAALERAVRSGEIGRSTDIEETAAVLTALFFGVPVLHTDAARARVLYGAGLNLVWRESAGRKR